MDDRDMNFLKQLIYNTEKEEQISILKNVDNPVILHCFAANYNWNNGFEVPNAILDNNNCDFGTGLLMFFYADGLRLLQNLDDVSNSSNEQWKNFLFKLYYKLLNNEFNSQSISYTPELTKIQVFKLEKNNPEISDIFITKSPGEVVPIPKL